MQLLMWRPGAGCERWLQMLWAWLSLVAGLHGAVVHVLPPACGCSAGQMSVHAGSTWYPGCSGPWEHCSYSCMHSQVPGQGLEHGMPLAIKQPRLLAVACKPCVPTCVCALIARSNQCLRLVLIFCSIAAQ